MSDLQNIFPEKIHRQSWLKSCFGGGDTMNTTHRSVKSQRPGIVLPMVVISLVILVTIGAGFMQLDLQSKLTAIRGADEIGARTAADAGLIKALHLMNQKLAVKPFNDATLPQAADEALPNADGTFGYTVSGTKAAGYHIRAVGDAVRSRRKVNASLQLKGLFDFAVFTKEKLVLRNGTTVDWYIPDADGDNLKVGTNSITENSLGLDASVTINGDIAVGVGGDPDTVIQAKNDATIAGSVYALPEEQVFPIIDVPPVLKTATSLGNISTSATIAASAKYDQVYIGNSGVIMIDGPVTLYVPGDIILDNAAQLQVNDANPDASLTLYLGGNLILKNGGFINNLTKDPKRLKIFGLDSCHSIDFRTACEFYGAIYAPNADVRSHNSVQIYGSIIANTFIQDVSANLWYDASLRDVSYNDIGVRFVIDHWFEN